MCKRITNFQWITLLAIIILSAGCERNSPVQIIPFEKKSSMPGSGRASAVSFAVNGKGYVALGRNAANVQLNDCWEYDPATDSWRQKSAFPGIPRVKATAAVLNGKAYIGLGHNNSIGVYNAESLLRDFWEYNPENDSWRRLADFPSNFSVACVSFVQNEVLYVGHGFSEAGFGGELWSYQPEKDKWIRLNDFKRKKRFGSVACSNGLQTFFGTGFQNGNWNDWWEYNPTTDSWTELKPMPDKGRVNGVALSVNHRFFVAAGRHFGGNLTGGHVKSDLLEYDAAKNKWYKRGDISGGGRENAVAFTIDGKGYIGFGENDEKVLNDFWSFKP